jgi:hypothetical protein
MYYFDTMERRQPGGRSVVDKVNGFDSEMRVRKYVGEATNLCYRLEPGGNGRSGAVRIRGEQLVVGSMTALCRE